MPPVSEWYDGYCDGTDLNACDTSPYLEEEIADYLQGYADGSDQVLDQEFGMSTPEIVKESYSFT